jgi:hypothetical protein
VIDNTEDAGCVLEAFDLLSGQQRYGRRLSDYVPRISSSGRSGFAVLRGEQELFLSLVCTPRGDAVTIINGENGHLLQAIIGDFGTTPTPDLLQGIFGDFGTTPTLHVHPRRREFAILWPDSAPWMETAELPKIHVRNFALGSGGLFHETRSALLLPRCRHKRHCIDVDPFRYLVASLVDGTVKPQVQTLGPTPAGYFKEEDPVPAGGSGGERYVPEQSQEITLPPVSRGQGRRQFCFSSPENGSVGFGIRFADGDRVLFRVESETPEADGWYLFDFALDIPQVRRTKEVHSRCRLQ